MTPCCQILSVILVAGVLLHGIGQVWLRWGDSVGTDTLWGWTGIHVGGGCAMPWRGHRPQKRLSLWIGGRSFSLLTDHTVCRCTMCESLRSFSQNQDSPDPAGVGGD